jgi:thiosulfate reductase cytochrome b subunit
MAVLQVRYYVAGIFRGEPHPMAKTPQHRLNPLQQVTYLAILNVLLPLQIVTGLAIYLVEVWPSFAAALGGLAVLGPLHTLGAWLFAGFLLMHIYLTTTGPTPTAYLRAMITGWEESEEHEAPAKEATP